MPRLNRATDVPLVILNVDIDYYGHAALRRPSTFRRRLSQGQVKKDQISKLRFLHKRACSDVPRFSITAFNPNMQLLFSSYVVQNFQKMALKNGVIS